MRSSLHATQPGASSFRADDFPRKFVKHVGGIQAERAVKRVELPIKKAVICPTIVGRVSELAALQPIISGIEEGRAHLVLFSGEAGIGKSRLVAALADDARSRGFLVLQGNCFQRDRTSPYAPMLDLVRSFLADHPRGVREAHFQPFAQEFFPLFPDLVTPPPVPAVLPASGPEQEQRRLFVALTAFFTKLAAGRPLVLVIEDIHWCDESSLEFLQYFLRHSTSFPWLVLLTYRSDEVDPALSNWLAQQDRERRTQECSLARLTRSDVEAMLTAIFDLPQTTRSELLNALYPLTEGNPFFVEEVLTSLQAAGGIFYAEGAWRSKALERLRLPRSISAAVQQRSDRLSEEARELLTLAAVAGRRFEVNLLLSVTRQTEEQFLHLLKELMAAQLVVEESGEQFAFRHALTRYAIYEQLLKRERKALHRTLAEAMERVYHATLDAHLEDLADHFTRAEVWTKALTYAQRAGGKAQSLYAPRAAVQHFTNALEAAHHLELPPPAHLHLARGQAQEMLGELEEARLDYERAQAEAKSDHDGSMEWRSLMALGQLSAGRDYSRAGEWFRQAETLASTLADPPLQAHSLNRLANWYVNTGRTAEGIQTHQEALRIFEARQDQPGMAETLDLLGMAHGLHGDLVSAVDYLGRAIDLFRSQGNTPSLVSALASQAVYAGPALVETTFSALGTPAACLRDATEALELARKIEDYAAQAYANVMTAWWLAGFGDFGAAQAHAQEALRIATEIGHQQWMAATYCVLGRLFALMLDPTQAIQLLEAGLPLAHTLGSAWWLGNIRTHLALAYLLRRENAKARAVLEGAMLADVRPRNLAERRMLWAWGELALASGNGQEALRIARQLLASPPGASRAQTIPWLLKLQGEALAAMQHLDEAAQTLEEASDGALRQQERPLLWQVHRSLGRVYHRMKDEDRAERAFTAARSVIAELAASIHEPAMRELFSQEALQSLPREKPIPERRALAERFGGLTEREREVAALIAQGRTNREIADTLVVSLRTVETHVSTILSKLGVASRSRIAVWAVEVGLVKDGR
jgi:DNA-binding CsgD family transcriptional regulator/tetratricopeptide (TPR) repeat protein